MFHHVRVWRYPGLPLNRRKRLPKTPGIYYAVRWGKVLYVGLSKNIYERWNRTGDAQHDQLKPLLQMGQVKLHYRPCPPHRLKFEEAKEILLFQPPLNSQKPDPGEYLTIRIGFEIAVFWMKCLALAGLAVLSIWSHYNDQYSTRKQSPSTDPARSTQAERAAGATPRR